MSGRGQPGTLSVGSDRGCMFMNLSVFVTTLTPCWCLKGFASYWSNPLFFIFHIRALWRSGLNARAPECQKIKMVGYTSLAKCNALTGSAVKGLTNKNKKCTLKSGPLIVRLGSVIQPPLATDLNSRHRSGCK